MASKMLKRALLQSCLIVALALTQVGAAVHSLSHLGEVAPTQQDKQLPHSKVCPQCVAYAQMGSALAASPLVVAAAEIGGGVVESRLPFLRTIAPLARLPRAPPSFL